MLVTGDKLHETLKHVTFCLSLSVLGYFCLRIAVTVLVELTWDLLRCYGKVIQFSAPQYQAVPLHHL